MSLLKRIEEEVAAWPHITVHGHRFGGREFRFGNAELGHVHEGGVVDIPFPRPGMNLRAYDSKQKAWNLKWLNALAGTWTDLGSEELGGVRADEKAISYVMKEPVARHAFTRATYTNISPNHFTWIGEASNDRKTWEEFMTVESYRREN